MTMILKLAFDYAPDEVDFLSGPDPENGWRLQSWKAQSGFPVPGQRAQPVVERLTMLCDAGSHNALAGYFQTLDQARRWAPAYIADPTVSDVGDYDKVWLHVKMDNESGERRALVRAIGMKWLSNQIASADGAPESRVRVQLDIEREPWWEALSATSWLGQSEASGACVVYDYTNSGASPVVGDVPARIRHMTIRSDATGSRVGRLWIGLRSEDKHNTLDDFEPIWECEDGTPGTDAALAADATASPTGGGNTKVTVTPGTATWAKRLTITLGDVTSADYNNLGFYLWLLRYKLSAGSSTWDAQLRFGYSGMADDDFVRGDIVELDNSSWDYIEMEAKMLPVRGRFYTAVLEVGNTVQIWARRTSGGANLDLDCLVPLTVDEGWLKIEDVDLAAGSVENLSVSEHPDGFLQAREWDTSGILAVATLGGDNFRLPVGDGRMYVVYAGPTDSDLTTGGISFLSGSGFVERWANLRGAE